MDRGRHARELSPSCPSGCRELLDHGERLTDVGEDVQLGVEDVVDHALFVGHVGDPTGHEPQALGDAKGAPQAVVGVRQEDKGQVVVVGERLVDLG